MQNPSNTPAESSAESAQTVTKDRRPVVYSDNIRVAKPHIGSEFRFSVFLHAENQDMPGINVSTGGANFQLYPTPQQARRMAELLVRLAEAADCAAVHW